MASDTGRRGEPRGREAGPSRAELTRRRFLRALGLAGAALGGQAAAGPAHASPAHASPPAAETRRKRQWAYVIDLRRCDGCDECTTACQKAHYLSADQTWIKVHRRKGPTGRVYFMPSLCMQCEEAPCVKVCPVSATYANNDGVVLNDQSTCIGSRACMAACPYEARYFNWTEPPPAPALLSQPMPEFPVPQQKGTVGKCILCVHNIDKGKLPVCVEACTMGALYIGDMKTDVATNGLETVQLSRFLKENDAVRLREELGTRPRVWYIAGHGQKQGL